MLVDVYSMMRIVDDLTGLELMIALTKHEHKTLVKNGTFSDEFIKKTIAKYNQSKQNTILN
jgi:hypothetical protein